MTETAFSFTPYRVLLVEDNDFIRLTVRRHLNCLGFDEVLEAANGFEGMKLLESGHPDIVVCDIRMEPVNGFDFLDHVRGASSPHRGLPFVFLTASADPSDVKKAMDSGIDGYLLKPVSADDLAKKMAEILSRIKK